MKRFADLFEALDATTSTNAKVEAMEEYFATAPPEDAAWAAWFLSGRRPKRLVRSTDLRAWATEAAAVPSWLFEECYAAVGDLAETVALLLDRPGAETAGGGGTGAGAAESVAAGAGAAGSDVAGSGGADPGGAGADAEVDAEAPAAGPVRLRDLPLSRWLEDHLLPLRRFEPDEQRQRVVAWWHALPARQTFLLNKLLAGGFRVGVSQTLVARALAGVAELPRAAVAHRLMGNWEPTATFFRTLLSAEGGDVDLSRPYPFFLASPLPDEPAEALGRREDWLAEWKWDGIRAQAIRRGGTVFLWSRGEELITDRFPELSEAAKLLPDGTVLDGEVLAWRFPEGGAEDLRGAGPDEPPPVEGPAEGADEGGDGDGSETGSREADSPVAGTAVEAPLPVGPGADSTGGPLPFAVLQRRIGRKRVTEKVLRDAPAAFLAYDLLEAGGEDLRERPLSERRRRLAAVLEEVAPSLGPRPRLLLSPEAVASRAGSRAADGTDASATGADAAASSPSTASWAGLARLREESRERGVEGLMLKRRSSPYRTGRKRGDWWKWKVDPYTVDAVMIYAQAGHGRRANLFTDYTFAVWSGDELVPVAKAYSGLSDEEILRLDRWIRRHTRERFGPVRSVEPVQVFEIAFEGIRASGRHKAGLAVRFPRIARWRTDKPLQEADRLETLQELLGQVG